jgi:hypothetical protein
MLSHEKHNFLDIRHFPLLQWLLSAEVLEMKMGKFYVI